MRAALRQHGVPVKHHARDLGAHVAMSKQLTNCTQTQRLGELNTFWEQLRNSRAGYARKLGAIRTVAWPRGLHAISNAHIGNSHWVAARRQATKALHMQKPGVNPLLHLGLVEKDVDPQLVAILHTFKDARQFRSVTYWESEVYPAAHGDLEPIPTSPVAILVARMQLLGLAVLPDGAIRDVFGTFHPALVNFHELAFRIQAAWQGFVAAQLVHRAVRRFA